jgi:quinol monooxygenase YgiN
MPIGVFVTMTASAGNEAELLAKVKDVIAEVRTEPGNLMAAVMRDPADPAKVHLFEIYRDEAALEDHRAAPHTVTKTPVIRSLYGAPIDIRFFEAIDWAAAEKAICESFAA